MKVNLTLDKAWKRMLEIELPSELVDEQFGLFQEKYRKQAKIDGFRPGRAPLEIVKAKFKDAIAKEVLDALLPKMFQDAIKESNLHPVSVPVLKELDFDQGKPLRVKAEIEVMPEFQPKEYQGIRLVRKVMQITEREINQALEYLRERNAQLVTVERESQDGDFLVLDLERRILGDEKSKPRRFSNQLVGLGSEGSLKEIQEGLRKVKANDKREIEVNYPGDYFQKKLAGRKALFKIEVKEVKEKVLPQATDDFAKSLGEYQDLDQLRSRLRENLEKKAREDNEAGLKSELVKKVVEANPVEVPPSMLVDYLDSVVSDFKKQYAKADEHKIREQYKEIGLNRIRWSLIYRALAEKEKIEVRPDEVENWTEGFAKNYSLELNKAKQFLAQNRRIEDIKETILEEKILNYLLEKAEITEERLKPKEGEEAK